MMAEILFIRKKILTLLIVFLLTIHSQSQLAQIPSLYLDRINVWNVNGTEHGLATNGYDCPITWRKTLPNVLSSSLALVNFKTSTGGILSYTSSFSSIDTTSAVINIKPISAEAKLVYLSFSVIVVTTDNPYVELLSVQASNITATLSNNYSILLTSSKFNISGSDYYLDHFIEYITGEVQYTITSFYNYWCYAYFSVVPATNEIRISFWNSYLIYMTGFKVNILILAKNAGSDTVIRHYNRTQYVEFMSMNFTFNLGIDQNLFGNQDSGHCLHGFQVLDLYVYPNNTGKFTSVLFAFNGSDVVGMEHSTIYGFDLVSLCYATCPTAYLYNGNCMLCRASNPFCLECLSGTICSSCLTGEFTLSADKLSCYCPVRKFPNETSLQCQSCHFDCYTCDATGLLCLSCNSTIDHRLMNNSTKRCIPETGYYQNNLTVSAQCHPTCAVCNSSAQCDPCPVRQYRSRTTFNCESCPYDCYTCDSSTLLCLTCNSSVDHRIFNSSTGRCDPISGYYESNNTGAGQCDTGCTTCQSATNCSACLERYYRNLATLACEACPYDCYTCDGAGNCNSCNRSTDFRQLNGSLCSPVVGYFESGTMVAGKCSNGCDYCQSEVKCLQCNNVTYLEGDQCVGSCSQRYYTNEGNRSCQACPYDCYTCDAVGNCTSCNSSDNRHHDNNTMRCIPLVGFYQIFTRVCPACNSPCQQCISASKCHACEDGFVLVGDNCFLREVKKKTVSVQQEGSGSNIGPVIAGVLIGLGIVITVVVCLVRKYRSRRDGDYRGGDLDSRGIRVAPVEVPRDMRPLARLIVPNNGWRDMEQEQISDQCTFCLDQQTTLFTDCTHWFHPLCIKKWVDQNDQNQCPNCHKRIGNNNKLVCRQCGLKARKVTRVQLTEIVDRGQRPQDTICDRCRGRPARGYDGYIGRL